MFKGMRWLEKHGVGNGGYVVCGNGRTMAVCYSKYNYAVPGNVEKVCDPGTDLDLAEDLHGSAFHACLWVREFDSVEDLRLNGSISDSCMDFDPVAQTGEVVSELMTMTIGELVDVFGLTGVRP